MENLLNSIEANFGLGDPPRDFELATASQDSRYILDRFLSRTTKEILYQLESGKLNEDSCGDLVGMKSDGVHFYLKPYLIYILSVDFDAEDEILSSLLLALRTILGNHGALFFSEGQQATLREFSLICKAKLGADAGSAKLAADLRYILEKLG